MKRKKKKLAEISAKICTGRRESPVPSKNRFSILLETVSDDQTLAVPPLNVVVWY